MIVGALLSVMIIEVVYYIAQSLQSGNLFEMKTQRIHNGTQNL